MLANCVQEGWPLRQEMQERNSRSPPHMTSSLLRTERHASYLSFLDAWAYLEHTPEHTLEHTPEHTLEMYPTCVSSKLCQFIWPPSPPHNKTAMIRWHLWHCGKAFITKEKLKSHNRTHQPLGASVDQGMLYIFWKLWRTAFRFVVGGLAGGSWLIQFRSGGKGVGGGQTEMEKRADSADISVLFFSLVVLIFWLFTRKLA